MTENDLMRAKGMDPTDFPITSADRAPHGRHGSDDVSRAPSDGPVGVGEYGRESGMGVPTPEGMADGSGDGTGLVASHPGSRSEVGVV